MLMNDTPDLTRKATLLVVDDTPANLALMSDLLKDSYKVKVATGGVRALEIARSVNPPDLILLDIMMPELDGYAVCMELKKDPKTSGIPVVFLTAKSEPEDEKKGLELGACDYITKPISPSVVMARIQTQLQLKKYSDQLENMVRERTRALAKSNQQLEKIIATGIELGNERDYQKLLQRILVAGQNLLHCAAGTFFLMTGNSALRSAIRTKDGALPVTEIPLTDPQTGRSNDRDVLVYCAMHGETVVINDLHDETRFDVSGVKRDDADTGYPTVSMLTVPLMLRNGKALGVLQFVNARDPESGKVIPFYRDHVSLMGSLAGLAAPILENSGKL